MFGSVIICNNVICRKNTEYIISAMITTGAIRKTSDCGKLISDIHLLLSSIKRLKNDKAQLKLKHKIKQNIEKKLCDLLKSCTDSKILDK